VIELGTQNALRAVRSLPFCYLCGGAFDTTRAANHDHVPPKTVFALADRQPLKLKTHEACNSRHSLNDEKIGQLIALQRGEIPEKAEDRKLHLAHLGLGFGAITNLNVDAALWRWISGFHAALYREPLTKVRGSIVTPFPRADKNAAGCYVLAPVYPQHQLFVDVIKAQRRRGALDRISANNGKLAYECVWGETDAKDAWLCMFALNIYHWKVLGKSPLAPARGCAGCYALPAPPPQATTATDWKIMTPNSDPMDPFAP
jgi:hypothetical protein